MVKNTMRIKLSNIHKCVFFLLFAPLFARFFTDNFGLSYTIMPLFDMLLFFLLFLAYWFKKKQMTNEERISRNWLLLYCIVATISIAYGNPNLSDIFYEIRPFFRLICSFALATMVLNIARFDDLYKIIRLLLYINIPIMLVQFSVWGLRQDILGGLFGNNQGVNSIQNLLCIFLFTVALVKYIHNHIKFVQLLMDLGVVIIIAVLAEINYLLIEMAIVSLLSIAICKGKNVIITNRKIILLFWGVITSFIAVSIFLKINPERAFLFNIDNILEYIGFNESTGVYKISRVRVFFQLGNLFFKNDVALWIFGFGLGNCSIHSNFYSIYGELQYSYFSTSMIFLQTGFMGIILSLSNYFYMLMIAINNRRLRFQKCAVWGEISLILTILMVMLFFYNGSSRDIYTAYFVGAIIALPLIVRKEVKL